MDLFEKPEVIRCLPDAGPSPRLSALELRWAADTPACAERIWHLPQGVTILSAAPTRFGIVVERLGDDAFAVRVLWNQTCFAWNSLRRVDVLTSSLSLILQALDTDVWQLLQQPTALPLAA